MRYFIAIALIVAVASAKAVKDLHGLSVSQMDEIQQILEAIHSPSTDPTTAAMLEQMLEQLLGVAPVKPPTNIPAIIDDFEPIHIGPAIIDEFEPIHIGPAIIDEFEPIHIGPAIIEELQPVDVSPEIVDFPVPENIDTPASVVQAPNGSPLVQIIVNVNPQGVSGVSPVVVDHVEEPSPVIVVEDAEESEINPSPVIIVDEAADAKPEPVLIGHLPEAVDISPVIVAPAVNAPDTLN